jgi:hypothetical protein
MLKTRVLGAVAAAAATVLVATGSPANAQPAQVARPDAAGLASRPLVEMTTPQNQGMFYTASAREAERAESIHGFKRTTTPLGEVATRPFVGGWTLDGPVGFLG